MVKIACLSPYSEDQVRELAGSDEIEVFLVPDPPAPEAVRMAVLDADVVIGDQRHEHRLDRAALALMKGCRLIQSPAAGFDAIDHQAAAEFGIPVANGGGYNRDTVADWVIMGMLNLLRHGARRDREVRAGQWKSAQLEGRELGALTVGIIGMGNIGSAVASRLRAFGSRLLYADVTPRGDVPGAEQVTLAELLAQSEIVTVHIPLDPGTRRFLGADQLAAMRPGALLVNTSRGPIIDEAALVAALTSGHLGGAALDVFETEPLPPDSPLRSMENVFITPHIGGTTREANLKLREVVAANLRRVLAGQQPLHVVNGVTGHPVPGVDQPIAHQEAVRP
jgi:phosphoglycerate dehydrogenase-like enzyme